MRQVRKGEQMSEFEEIFKGFNPGKKKVLTKQGKRLTPSGKAPKPPPFARSLEEGEAVYCPTCGADAEVIEKGGKKRLKHKGPGAKAIGNEMAPHKGPASGQAPSVRGGRASPTVDRAHAGKPKSGVVKSEGTEEITGTVVKSLFPSVNRVQLVEYVGASDDNALAKQIQDSKDGRAHSLYTPSSRNLAMEQAGSSEE